MNVDRKRWQEQLNKRKGPKIPAGLLQIARAAPKMETLTHSPEWDEFLSHVQAHIAQAAQGVEALKGELLDPSIWSHEELVRLKSAILCLEDRVAMLNSMIEIPKRIMERGKEVDKIFEQTP